MQVGKIYKITKRIKVHTNPEREVDVSLIGMFAKETESYYCFDKFRVRKANVVDVKGGE